MKKASYMRLLILVALAAVVCMAGVSFAADNADSRRVTDNIAAHQHHDNDGCGAAHAGHGPALQTSSQAPMFSPEFNRASLFTSGASVLYAGNIPEPQCVCAGCKRKCGTGHTSICPYRPKK